MAASANLLDAYITLKTRGNAEALAAARSLVGQIEAAGARGPGVGQALAEGRSAALSPKAPAGQIAIQRELDQRLAAVQARYDKGRISAKSFGEQAAAFTTLATDKARLLGEQLGKQELAARKLATVYGTVSGILGGFVRQGLAGTTMGARMGLQMQLLSREIASLFIPVLERVIGFVQGITDWFRRLSGAQQEALGRWLTFGVALLGVLVVLPRLVAGLQAVGVVLTFLSANPFVALLAGIAALITATGTWGEVLEGIRDLFGGIVSTVGGFLSDLDDLLTGGRVGEFLADVRDRAADLLGLGGGGGGPGQNRRELVNVSHGPESIAASFTRFQTAALRTGQGSVEQQQLDTQREIRDAIRQGNQAQPAPPAVN